MMPMALSSKQSVRPTAVGRACGARVHAQPCRATAVVRQCSRFAAESFYIRHALRGQCVVVRTAATDSRVKAPTSDSDSDLKHLSPDILSMFHETQKNMLELNKSRLKALEELKEARKTIADLENKVNAYEKELVALRDGAVATVQAPVPLPPRVAAPTPPPPPPAPMRPVAAAPPPPPPPAPVQAPPQAAPPAPPPPAPVNTITIKYYSGWDTAFLHYNLESKGWTQVPGEKLASDPDGGKSIALQGKIVEFVLTNGKNDWDSPMGAGNYHINGYGVYKLKSGKIEKLS